MSEFNITKLEFSLKDTTTNQIADKITIDIKKNNVKDTLEPFLEKVENLENYIKILEPTYKYGEEEMEEAYKLWDILSGKYTKPDNEDDKEGINIQEEDEVHNIEEEEASNQKFNTKIQEYKYEISNKLSKNNKKYTSIDITINTDGCISIELFISYPGHFLENYIDTQTLDIMQPTLIEDYNDLINIYTDNGKILLSDLVNMLVMTVEPTEPYMTTKVYSEGNIRVEFEESEDMCKVVQKRIHFHIITVNEYKQFYY